MTVPVDQLSDPAVRAFVTALNANDRAAFQAALAPGATMSDDGSDRDVADWTEREVFSSNGRMEVEEESDGGLALVATYTNDTWGSMRTAWRFTVTGGKVSRFDTGQAGEA
ncbi:nuclear transport factor 2 family protein [Streptomyces sp. NPDC004327]|uniref:nuclear transport factor 2 family protein n=1 Tax=unclassified Streptomyces TaxID=2593676 RepID=UPI0036B9703C